MLGKLIKYEFKATMRSFLAIYASLILTGVLIGIFMFANVEVGMSLGMLIMVALMITLGVLTITVIIKRFSKNLLGDEGYLMMTLPVSAKKIVASKIITSVVYLILSTIVVFLVFVVIMLPSGMATMEEFIQSMGNVWNYMVMNLLSARDIILNIIITLIIGIVDYVSFILVIYTSLSVGQLKPFNKHRTPVAIIAFFIINMIVSVISDVLSNLLESMNILTAPQSMSMLSASSIYTLVFYGVVSVVLFMITSYILEKKLNLE
ncbi:ABC transporter permease [Peptacetobacter sp. AB800]|uniref:ABC transporter permease n=1 Tax=Peptacetobacter sp. AB800 TaxID=3388428 RepID=UPI0039FC1E9E